MQKSDKEKPVPKRCVCGAEPVWSKTKLGFVFACPDCLLRGVWNKNKDKAIESWNTEVSQYWNKRLVKIDGNL